MTKKLLLLSIGVIMIYHLSEANIARGRHRLARETTDPNISTELRLIMMMDALAEIQNSPNETIKLYKYFVEKTQHEYFYREMDCAVWIMKYLNTDRFTYNLDDYNETGIEFASNQFCIDYIYVSYLQGTEYEDPADIAAIEEFNELLANATWCPNCVPFDLPDTRDRVEIAVFALEKYFNKVGLGDCAEPFLKDMWQKAFALPPVGISEETWYLARVFGTWDLTIDC